jgi:hypothetical protein
MIYEGWCVKRATKVEVFLDYFLPLIRIFGGVGEAASDG